MESGVKLFECVKIFEVEEGVQVVGRDSNGDVSESSHPMSATGIDLCCWRECSDHSMMVLFCNNGYLVMVMTPTHGVPVVKQLKWFESREQHILGLAMDPLGEWLACACLEGTLYLLPVLALTIPEHRLHNSFGPSDDISMMQPQTKKAQPTSVVWWESMDGHHVCITASEVGEVTFFAVYKGMEVATVMIGDCIDHMLLASHPSHSTHLLIGLRGGQWRRQLLEEQYHEAAGTSYTDAQASGFEIVPDDIVVKSFLHLTEPVEPFDFKPFPYFSEFNVIMTHDWRKQHFLSALNLQNYRMEVFTYDFDLLTSPLRTFQLVGGATGSVLLDRMLFVISHHDEEDACSFTLNLMSSQRASISDLSAPTPAESNSVLQRFRIPSRSNLVGFFSTSMLSSELAAIAQDKSGDQPTTPITNLGGCVIVTTTGVYQCRQVVSPEATFLNFVMSSKSHEKGEEFGITYRLDVCGLYQEAAERKLQDGKYKHALKLFELSRCSPSKIIDSFSSVGRITELVQYLHQLVYDDTNHTSLHKPKHIQNVLMKCFVHECLRLHGKPEGATMVDKFTQFLSEKFLYDQTQAMDLLIESGLKEQLFDMAKTHHRLAEALDRMIQLGALDVGHTLQPSLASRQYVKSLTSTGSGLFLHQMSPANFVRVLYAKPSIIPAHLGHLRSVMPQLDIANLLRIARLFDPSHSTIRPLLIKAHSNRRQSNSTSSMVSIATSSSSEGPEEYTPRLEAYLETFLVCLIILNQHRKHKPAGPNHLLSLSPLRSAVSGSSPGIGKSPTSYTEGSQWVRGSTVSCGMNHAAVVTHSDLYTWGTTKNGKLGHGDIEDEGKALPLRVETIHMLNIHVVSVSCGAEHTIALCQEGVFSWGSSLHGQLGHGDMLKKTRPVQITALADKSIVSVVCGQYHSLALDDDHQVWSWGWGVHGQLGLKSVDDRTTPTHSSLLDNKQVSYIAAGYGHSAILTAEGKVYTFGNGMYGQLGHGNTEKQSSPRMVEQLAHKTVYLLACGNFHTVVITTDQEIFYWGKNFSRQQRAGGLAGPQGLKEYKKSRERQTAGVGGVSSSVMSNTLQPVQLSGVELDDTVMQVSCGNYHSLLLTSAGSVYAWGSNVNGQLGLQSGEMASPKLVEEFEGHKIVAIASGDEFSLAVDEKGLPWVWGKGDKGQLGVPMDDHSGGRHHSHRHHTHDSTHSRRHHVLFKPRPIKSVSPGTVSEAKSPGEMSPDPNELPVLELDLGWELPDFAAIDSPHTPYGRKALDAALEHLHGFYRTAHVLWQCEDWKDWQSMTTIASLEQHWPQALRCAMTGLVEEEGVTEGVADKAVAMVKEYLEKLLDEHSNLFSSAFLHKAVDLLDNIVSSWEEHCLDLSALEEVLTSYLSSLCYPLSLILMRPNGHVSASFHLAVAREVLALVSDGHPTPASIIANPSPSDTSLRTKPEREVKRVTLETTKGDIRMWAEVLRNLMKDLSRSHSILLSENVLVGIRGWQPDDALWEKTEERRSSSVEEVRLSNENAIAAFSCGHAHPMARFLNQIVPEFVERVQNFPLPLPQTLRSLQLYYKQAQSYPSACPHCVFQFLRKLQIEQCPKVPIKPWSM